MYKKSARAMVRMKYCMCCARTQEETRLLTAQKYQELFQLVKVNITSASNLCIWCARRCSHALRLLEGAMEVDQMRRTLNKVLQSTNGKSDLVRKKISNLIPEPSMLLGVSVTIIGDLGFIPNDEIKLEKLYKTDNDKDPPDYDDILLSYLKVESVSVKNWDPLEDIEEELDTELLTDTKELTAEDPTTTKPHKKRSTSNKNTKNISQAKRKITNKYVDVNYDAKENSLIKSMEKSVQSGGKGRFGHLVVEIWITEEQRLAELESRRQQQSWLEAPHKCHYCIKGFSFQETYQKHMECHKQGDHLFACQMCGRGAHSAHALSSHERSHFRRYACSTCGFQRADRGSIVDHALSTHAPDARDALTCKPCNKTFAKLQILKKHEKRVHAGFGRCQCPHCGKWLQNTCSFRRHLLLHADASNKEAWERRYACGSCDVRFRTRYALQAHTAVHTEGRPQQCPHCALSFKTETVLRCHVRRRHEGRETFKHECDYCHKKFLVKSELRTHINWNHLQRGVKCPQCPKSYPSTAGVRKHVARVHERRQLPRDKMCHVCGKGFTDNGILNKHMLVHTGERPFVCHCGAAFGQSSTLRTHQRLVHLKLKRGIVHTKDDPATVAVTTPTNKLIAAAAP